MSYITSFYAFLGSLWTCFPAIVQALVMAVAGSFLFISVLKMLK